MVGFVLVFSIESLFVNVFRVCVSITSVQRHLCSSFQQPGVQGCYPGDNADRVQ